ncbi:hypothetical protein J5N97_009282 [Dioscorea zingiberensis]|uniref:Uncharacterized protein n=1 Tax=Dioscorea zingiberensis TaxID=325984 RepID=A0A9D5CYG7_9LILI|nr:hypothetical protein J5N97_009282 [Dioscorea zingiberensis]
MSATHRSPLIKQRSWSPDTERDEAWLRRKGLQRGQRSRLSRSVTEEDLDELRGCIDLGFGFEADSPNSVAARLSQTIPALDLYYAIHRSYRSSPSDASIDESPSGSPVSFFSPDDSPEVKKVRLRQWAQVVACSVRQCQPLKKTSGDQSEK